MEVLLHSSERQYLPSRVVCRRYNVCTRTLYRWREAPKLGFPKGIEINGRRYFASDELDEWDRRRYLGTNRAPSDLGQMAEVTPVLFEPHAIASRDLCNR